MTLLEQFDDVVDHMARTLNDSNMNRARAAADMLRKVQAEIHSCAKDQRVAAVNEPIEDTRPQEERPTIDPVASGMAAVIQRETR